MSHVLRNGDFEVHISNEAWREICSLAWEHGWLPRVPIDWQNVHDALHWQMEYGLCGQRLTHEETTGLAESLAAALRDESIMIGNEVIIYEMRWKLSIHWPFSCRAVFFCLQKWRIGNHFLINGEVQCISEKSVANTCARNAA